MRSTESRGPRGGADAPVEGAACDVAACGTVKQASERKMSKTQSLQFVRHPHPSPVHADKRAALLKNPGFGRVFSDHMVTIRYHESQGWHDARIEPRAPIPMAPAAAVLHHAQERFEGLKAYRTADGRATLFRPHENARRFQQSAERLAMPILPAALFLAALAKLVNIDCA